MKSKKIILITTSILMGLVLLRFSLSKILGEEESVNQFIEMAKPIGVNPTFFRVFIGGIMLIVSVLYLVNAIFVIKKRELPAYLDKVYLLGVLIMLGALMSEFLLRVSPKYSLVILSLIIIGFSSINFLFLSKSKNH